MKKEIRDRIKEIEGEIIELKKLNDEIVSKAQQSQQQIAQNNSEILKRMGGIEELKRVKD